MKRVLAVSAVILLSAGAAVAADRTTSFSKQMLQGSGKVIKTTRALPLFDRVQLDGGADVQVVRGATPSAIVETDDNLMEHVLTKVAGKTLVISVDKPYRSRTGISISLVVPSLQSFELRSSGNVIAKDLQGKEFAFETQGSGDAKLFGKVENLRLSIQGSGDVDATQLETADARADIQGSGNINLFATKSLDASIQGSGDIQYKGNATVRKHIQGSGSIQKM